MKKRMLVPGLILVVGLFVVTTSQVFGSAYAANDGALSAGELPGVKPTQKMNDHIPGPPDKNKDKGKPVNIKGTISSADAASLTINLDDGSSVTVMISADTRISIPGTGGAGGAGSLLPGLQVGVQAVEKDGVLTARSIHVIPGKPVQSHNIGLVTDYQPDVSISIAARDGQTYTFLLSPDIKILPAEHLSLLVAGAYVTVISPRDVTTTDNIATGIVIHPAVPPGQKITPQPTLQATP
ncbi:MAG: hypothetical protein JXR32_03310 [Anaerolineaceae bacterium]|nr:hypothetical protein [Anaerolineaceae bacterium]